MCGGVGFLMISNKEVPYCVIRELTNPFTGEGGLGSSRDLRTSVKNALIWIPLLEKYLNFCPSMSWLPFTEVSKWSQFITYLLLNRISRLLLHLTSLHLAAIVIKWKQRACSINPTSMFAIQNISPLSGENIIRVVWHPVINVILHLCAWNARSQYFWRTSFWSGLYSTACMR